MTIPTKAPVIPVVAKPEVVTYPASVPTPQVSEKLDELEKGDPIDKEMRQAPGIHRRG